MCMIGRKFYVVDDKHRKHPSEQIKLPQRSSLMSAGYDFYLPIDILINPNSKLMVWTDVKISIGEDEFLSICPRSSLGVKGLILSNTVAIVDADYILGNSGGNIGLNLWNTTNQPIHLSKGDRVAQGVLQKYLITNDDSPISRDRVDGFGSSGGN